MKWIAEPIQHLIEYSYISKNGKKNTFLESYDSTKNIVNISMHFLSSDKKVIIKPITLEHFKINIEEKYNLGVVKELFVGIRNDTDI